MATRIAIWWRANATTDGQLFALGWLLLIVGLAMLAGSVIALQWPNEFKSEPPTAAAVVIAIAALLIGLSQQLADKAEARSRFYLDAYRNRTRLLLEIKNRDWELRSRQETKVQQTLGRPAAEKEPDQSLAWGWRWILGLAAATAVVIFVALPMFRTPNAPVIQLAMLDTSGGTRGTDTNEAALLRVTWSKATLDSFTNLTALREWETKPKPDAVKIIYDRAAAEVKVLGKWRGKSFEKTFLVEQDLATALAQAKAFIGEQTKQ